MPTIADTYREMTDSQIIELNGEIDDLTQEARGALKVETDRRGLSDEQIAAQQLRWKEETQEQRKVSKKLPVPRTKILGQFFIILAAEIIYSTVVDVAAKVGLIHLSSMRLENLAQLAGTAMLVSLLIAMRFLRGRVMPTLIMTLLLYALVTVATFRLH